ncbi:Endoribonuclease Dicer homolog 2-like protein [Drosera capensis]
MTMETMDTEEAFVHEIEKLRHSDDHACYLAPELVSVSSTESLVEYYCYLIKMENNFDYDVSPRDIVLLVKNELHSDVGNIDIDMEVGRGNMGVHVKYNGRVTLTQEQVLLGIRFQVAIFRVLLEKDIQRLMQLFGEPLTHETSSYLNYLVLPCAASPEISSDIDWTCVNLVISSSNNFMGHHMSCRAPGVHRVHTKNGLVCSCMLVNCLVYTPHNNLVYCISGFLHGLNGCSDLMLSTGEVISYKSYYKRQHGINLQFMKEALLRGRRIFGVQNYLQKSRQQRKTEPSHASVELPPELCSIIITPLSISTLYTYSFIPSIMHRIESLLLSSNLKKMISDQCEQIVDIPAIKVLEAFTTRKCQENFHLESLETLGDSFLKYAVSQQLFRAYENHHEGLLSAKREKIISNAALAKLGLEHDLPGFIRAKPFDPKEWAIPGDPSGSRGLKEEVLISGRKIYNRGSRKIKSKTVADVVEALIGVYLNAGGELAALLFMNWLGIDIDFSAVPYTRKIPVGTTDHVNNPHLQALLNYTFKDNSLLLEALTHGSFTLTGVPRSYQRLEFLGDAVLDYLVTVHLYTKFPGLSPGELTDLRSASVSNNSYAQAALRAGLYKHIFHASQALHKHLNAALNEFEQLSADGTHGWDTEISFPKVLADIIESLAGAIFLDSGYDKEAVFRSLRPLLEPLVTPDTMKLHPVKELQELCAKHDYHLRKPIVSFDDGFASMTLEVEADGDVYSHTCSASDRKTAKRIASKAILKSLKENIPGI